MPGEIKQLLEQIEQEQLAARRGLAGVASVARHAFISARMHTIDQAHQRLLEICGPTATEIVCMALENADLLHDCQVARAALLNEMREEH